MQEILLYFLFKAIIPILPIVPCGQERAGCGQLVKQCSTVTSRILL